MMPHETIFGKSGGEICNRKSPPADCKGKEENEKKQYSRWTTNETMVE